MQGLHNSYILKFLGFLDQDVLQELEWRDVDKMQLVGKAGCAVVIFHVLEPELNELVICHIWIISKCNQQCLLCLIGSLVDGDLLLLRN